MVMVVCLLGVAHSDTSEGVVITVSGNYTAPIVCPVNLTIDSVSDYEIFIEWDASNEANATGTSVVGAFGRWPDGPTDGFEVYSGNSTNTTHWVNTEFMGTNTYYRLYTTYLDGSYSICYAEGSITGGVAVLEMATALTGMWDLAAFGLQLAFPGILFLVWMRWRSLVVALALMFAIWLSLDVYFEQGLQYAYPMIMLGIGTILMLIFDLFGRRIIRL
jgi:hypothetical protein